jgi:mono/diheme cytochrome c family protein
MFRRLPHRKLLLAILGGTFFLSGTIVGDEKEAFFESKVRPILAEHCVSCHGAKEQLADLRLDRRDAVSRGGSSGPAIQPGKPNESLLLRAVRYSDSKLQMPPDGKLKDAQIEIFEHWIRSGAYWPEDVQPTDPTPTRSPAERIDEIRQSHWAYQPIVDHSPPSTKDHAWPANSIDRFVLQKLEQSGLTPSPAADRRTLIRRAYFALIGLPPSFEEIEAFAADPATDAYDKLVDRLLDNRHYGERWARHWMDIARYAETMGYLPGSVDTRYPYAYTYRDYVIDAFNEDLAFPQFILEQIAADQLQLPAGRQKALAAMGFLTVGRKFMNREQDIIDDQIDVITRGFLGMSVSCARCHDHKYDPIPTADYYSLYGVFASSQQPDELPLLGDPTQGPGYDDFIAAKQAKQKEVDDWVEEKRIATEDELRSRVADYLVHTAKSLPHPNPTKSRREKAIGERGPLRPRAVQQWQQFLTQPTLRTDPVWGLLVQLAGPLDGVNPEPFVDKVKAYLGDERFAAVRKDVHPHLLDKLRQSPPDSLIEAAELVGKALEETYRHWREVVKESPAVTELPDPTEEALRKALFANDVPTTLDGAQMIALLDQGERNKYNTLLGQVKGVEVTHPGAPSRAMVLQDKANLYDPVVFRRGQAGNLGDRVPRRFLQVLAHVDGGKPFSKGSGRLELAQAIANPKNPLTARVIVNRVWQHHFGVGLVPTSSDFGFRGEPPTHPELLDHLAFEFMQDGWSIKRLQRRIMLSATWRQGSNVAPRSAEVDPENRLLSRMPRQRLEFEPLRDRVLVAAGSLDEQIGGRSVMIHEEANRRALYAYIDREDVPGLLATFDLPSPDASQAIRSKTTVPQQALFLLNSPFLVRQAQAIAEKTSEAESDSERVRSVYRRILTRDPDEGETAMALAFVGSGRCKEPISPSVPPAKKSGSKRSKESIKTIPCDPWGQFAQVLLLSNEFAYVD